jgi:hypothetical protein
MSQVVNAQERAIPAHGIALPRGVGGQKGPSTFPQGWQAPLAHRRRGLFRPGRETPAGSRVELATGIPADAVARIREAMALGAVMLPPTLAGLRLDPEFKTLRERQDFQAQ